MPTFRWIPVASPLHDPTSLDALLGTLSSSLERIGGERASEDDVAGARPLLYVVLTGGTETRLLELRRRRTEHEPGEPTLLVAHPAQNSLPAALETLARVHQLGGRGRIVYLRGPGDAEGLGHLNDAVRDLAVRRSMLDARIGLIGEPSDWLVASSPAPEVVQETWGPQVVRLDVAEVIRRHSRVPVTALASSVSEGAGSIDGPGAAQIDEASRVYPVLREIVETERLDALTVRCFDLITELRTSSCLALAELNDEGVIAGCEGDLVSTVAMLWIHRLLGPIPWMANPAQVDEGRNTLLIAHCTVPRAIVDGYRLRTHFESGLGVGLSGDIPPGDVTLVRIGGARMQELWLAEGTSLATEPREGLCRTQLEVELSRGSVADLLTRPLGNHLVLTPGHHADRLHGWRSTMIAA